MSSFSEFSVNTKKPRRPKKPKIGVHIVLCLVLAVGTAGIFVLYQRYRAQQLLLAAISAADEEPADLGPLPDVTPWPQPGGGEAIMPPDPQSAGGVGFDSKSPEETEPAEDPLDAAKQKAFNAGVAEMRKGMSDRDLSWAQSRLDQAGPNAQTDDERALIERLAIMLDNLKQFWAGTQEAVANLKPLYEFTAKGQVVVVTDVNQQQVTVKSGGVTRQYQLDDLHHLMVVALAEDWFADEPSSKVLLGTFFAVDPSGDPVKARELWQEAAAEGIEMDQLMPELEYWESVPRIAQSVQQLRDNPPSGELLKNTRRKIVQRYSEDYTRANDRPKKSVLARKIWGEVDEGGDPVYYLATIHEVRKLAIDAGNVPLVFEMIDVLENYEKFDPLAEKTTSLKEVGKNVRGTANRLLVSRALKLHAEAVAAKRAGEATILADVATAAAKQYKNKTLIRQAADAVAEAEALSE